jgi:hypothetical protein
MVLGVKWGNISLYWNNFLPQTRRPTSIKIDANYPYLKEIQFCLDERTVPHQREIITKMQIQGGRFI